VIRASISCSGTSTDNLAWKFKLPGRGFSTPIVWSERIIVTAPVEGKDSVLSLDLSGKLTISLDLVSETPSEEVYSGHVRVSSGPVVISGDLLQSLGFSPFNITSLSLVATVKDNVVTLGENGVDGDLNAVANGEIRLLPADLMASRLNLNVELVPGPDKKEKLGPIFALMGARTRSDGSINIRVRGTVANPSVTM